MIYCLVMNKDIAKESSKGGRALLEKYGKNYFKELRAKRKNCGCKTIQGLQFFCVKHTFTKL